MTAILDAFRQLLKITDEDSNTSDENSANLKRYDIIQKLNHGAFSEVYKVRDKRTGQYVAMKIMSKTNLKPRQKENILREAAIHKRLNSPYVVQFIDFFETSKNFYLVMELMNGGELFERIEKVECFTEDDAVAIIMQVAKGLKYLHDNGVVHRDIKPENLVFGNNSLTPIKLCDFGLSKVLDMGSTDTPCGTVGYLAPEIAKEMSHTFSVDMWALGCVLYSMLCGFPAFYDQSVPILTEKVKKGLYDFPSPWWDAVSDSAKDLVRNCLTVDPKKRFTINQFLSHPWLQKGKGRNVPLPSPAILKQMDNKVVNVKHVFDVACAAQRDIDEEIVSKNTVQPQTFGSLNSIKESSLLEKRAAKLKKHDHSAVVPVPIQAS